MNGRWLLGLLVIGVLMAAVWFAAKSSNVSVLTGEAHAAEGAISILTDDWTYAVPLDGVKWVDARNSWHDRGRPECMAPSTQTIPVTFAAVHVTIEGITWRPIVWVSCR